MQLHGKNFIGAKLLDGGVAFHGMNPAKGEQLEPAYYEATEQQIDTAMRLAERDFETYRRTSPEKVASFLDRIGEQISGLGDELIQKAHEETALPEQRLVGERARTVNQLKMFAALILEGAWVE